MPFRPEDEYHIGWICALREEMVAARAMLDEEDGSIGGRDQDHNTYFAGRVHEHNVVIAVLPAGVDGLVAAVAVAKDMIRTFTQLRFLLLVSIGGGVPNLVKDVDIRLGDIVVSQPSGISGGVVHYDKRKAKHGGGFELKGTMSGPPNVLLTAVHSLQAEHDFNNSQGQQISTYIIQMIERRPHLKTQGYAHPGESEDKLFPPTYVHTEGYGNCEQCSAVEAIRRQARGSETPRVHYGIIASGNQVVKDPVVRDELRDKYGALCIDMEAAALMNNFPCIVIRGICDYADSHKNNRWHRYAAVTAAAYAKELLLYVAASSVRNQKPIQEVLDFVQSKIQPLTEQLRIQEAQRQDEDYRRCHQSFKLSHYETQKNINPRRAPDTCLWVLEHPTFRKWRESRWSDLLWISATPGCGKSVLSKSLVDLELRSTDTHTCCYFFFRDNELQNNLGLALCAVLHQLFAARPQLLTYAMPAWRANGGKMTWEVDEMWHLLLKTSEDVHAGEISCIFDGLDECCRLDKHQLIEKLCFFYADSQPLIPRQRKLKFLVTSRPYDDIRSTFHDSLLSSLSSVPQIRLKGELEITKIGHEIDSVIRLKVADITAKARLSQELRGELERKLLEMRNRTYLWLSLAIGEIYETMLNSIRLNNKAVESAIKSLPVSVEHAYERILSRIPLNRQSMVKTILQIIIGAKRALDVSELSAALSLVTVDPTANPGEACIEEDHLRENIQEWCGLFVFIDHSMVYLVHQTAKEFLLWSSESERGIWKHSLNLKDAEEVLAQACIKSLCIELDRTRADASGCVHETYKSITKFLKYASEHWVGHFREADSQQCSFHSDILRIYEHPELGSWFAISFWQLRATRDLRHIYDADFGGWGKLRSLGLKQVLTSIHFAALLGHHTVLEKLLSQGKFNLRAADQVGHSTLACAMVQRSTRALSLLLQYGADVNAIGIYGTPLRTAILFGEKEVVQLLLDHGADVNIQADEGYGALHAAAGTGRREMVHLLLASGAEVGGGREYETAVQVAMRARFTDIVRLLLDFGADVSAERRSFTSGLHAAIELDHTAIMYCLFDHGADDNVPASHTESGFWIAARRRSVRSTQTSLNSDAKLESSHPLGWQNAWSGGREDSIRLLLDKGADPYARGYNNLNAFQVASAGNLLEVLVLLMSHTGRWKNVEQAVELRSEILMHYSDPNFWLSLSSDWGGIREIIDNMELRYSEWVTPVLWRFRPFPEGGSALEWEYIKFDPALWPKKPGDKTVFNSSKPSDRYALL